MEAGLSKLRVTELATEFGISPDETMAMLRALEITVRNPASPLTDEQVARARVRFEREKRSRADKSAADAAPSKKKAAAKKAAAKKAAGATGDAKPAAKKKVAAKSATKSAKSVPAPEPEAAPADDLSLIHI